MSAQPIESARIVQTNTGKTYVRCIDVLVGPQGYRAKESRTYVPDAKPVLNLHEQAEARRILAQREAKNAAAKAKRHASPDFGAMAYRSKPSMDRFVDYFLMADFSPITDGGRSIMPTLMYTDWERPEQWINKPWQTYKKHLDALNKHGLAAWGEDWAMVVHTEFQVEFDQRPHFHPWLKEFEGLSNYPESSKFASEKLNLQGRVFHRWLEAVWGYITGQQADLIEPRLTWTPRTAEERASAAQDTDTPLKIMNYWLKAGDNETMAEKRLQLRPHDAWIARKQSFRWEMVYGIALKYDEVPEVSIAKELKFREVASLDREADLSICEVTGEIRDNERFSVDARQGARQIGVVDAAKRGLLLAPFGLN